MEKVVVTGAAGFLGMALVETLLKNDVFVYAIVRPNSKHNDRLLGLNSKNICIIELDMDSYDNLPSKIHKKCKYFYHVAWSGGRTMEEQVKNIDFTFKVVKAAKEIGCERIIATGSQAEYGIVPPYDIIDEERSVCPVTPYGFAKVASCYLSRQYSSELGIEWVWGRIFSLIGKYEPCGRMLPDLVNSLIEKKPFHLSSCKQNWDFLNVYDGAEALVCLAKHGRNGEIYNVASGDFKQLKCFIKDTLQITGAREDLVEFGNDPDPFISIQPSIKKIVKDTGWKPKVPFEKSVKQYYVNSEN